MNKGVWLVIFGVVIIIGFMLISGGDDTSQEVSTQETASDDSASNEASEVNDGVVVEEETIDDEVADTVDEESSSVKTFNLDSFNFGYSETEIRVNEGDTVTVNLTNSEGFHDWVVDEFGAATEKIQAGGNTSVTFVADKAGTYEYYCSVGSHRANGMVGNLIVE